MATWDSSLPQSPSIRGFKEELPDLLIRSKMDTGSDKVRRRSTAQIRKLEMTFLMTKAQVATFETFFYTTTNGGADKFTFTHPRTGVSSDKFRFDGTPSYSTLNGEYYRVAVKMELLP